MYFDCVARFLYVNNRSKLSLQNAAKIESAMATVLFIFFVFFFGEYYCIICKGTLEEKPRRLRPLLGGNHDWLCVRGQCTRYHPWQQHNGFYLCANRVNKRPAG